MTETPATVYFVGAGPGDPGLLTVRAVELLSRVDVVVYDRLVSDAILDLIPPGTTRIFAGKVARHHHMPQAEINTLLASVSRSGRTVARLKGGDPFVFGRGGEEAAFLAGLGIPFEVVPGVTSATGCSAYAGIPLTHRDLAHGFRVVTGHAHDDEPLAPDWASLADPDTTLVVYMGRTNVRAICGQLIANGLDAETPAAAVVNGTRPAQWTLLTTLSELPDLVEAVAPAPTLLVIGRVVSLASTLAWFTAPADDDDAEAAG